jgi:succinate dehydrogenase / fumarate reductase flavoprotein subunit
MLDLVIVDGRLEVSSRNLVTGEIERHSAHAVVIASGGYGNVFFLSTNAMGSNATAAWKIHKKGLLQIHVTHKFTQHVFLFQEIINF